MPAEVAAVLEGLAADATPVGPLPQLPRQLPPDAVAARENQAPLEGDAAALLVREPAGLDTPAGETGGRQGGRRREFKVTVTLERGPGKSS